MFESFTNECGCQFVRELSSEYGRISYSVSNFCNLHNPLSFGVGARGAKPEGYTPSHACKPQSNTAEDARVEAALSSCWRVGGVRKLCVRCGQECLPDGTCHCGATPVTQCVTGLTPNEQRKLHSLLITEHTELLLERRQLAAIRESRRDGSWSSRIESIDIEEQLLRSMIAKVQP